MIWNPPVSEPTIQQQLRRGGAPELAKWYSAQRRHAETGTIPTSKAAAIISLQMYGPSLHPDRGWTDQQIMLYLHRFGTSGYPPTQEAYDRWAQTLPGETAPTSSTVLHRFGWAKAMIAAGLQPVQSRVRTLDLAKWPQQLADFQLHTASPHSTKSYEDWCRHHPQIPSIAILRRTFGSFAAAVAVCQQQPSAGVRASLNEFVRAGVGLSVPDYERWHQDTPGTVPYTDVRGEAGRFWTVALAWGGATLDQIAPAPKRVQASPEQSLLRFSQSGLPPTHTDYKQWQRAHTDEVHINRLIKVYGGLAPAFLTVGLQLQRRPESRRVADSKILDDLRSFYQQTGETEVQHYLRWRAGNRAIVHSKVISDRFGSWADALVAALQTTGELRHQPFMVGIPSAQQDFLLAMAQDDLPSRVSDIARRLGIPVNEASYHKRRLRRMGLVQHTAHNIVDFTRPELRQLLRRYQPAAAPSLPAGQSSDRQIVSYIQRFMGTGRPAVSAQYKAWAELDAGAPSLATIRSRLGPWDRALRLAGIRASRNSNTCDPASWPRHYTAFCQDTPPPHSGESYRWYSSQHLQVPGYQAVRATFGTWAAAAAAGQGLAVKSVLNSMARFVQAGVGLDIKNYRQWYRVTPGVLSIDCVLRRAPGKTWAAALALGGATPQQIAQVRRAQLTDPELALASLLRYKQTGQPPASRSYIQWQQSRRHEASYHMLIRVWGNWQQALQAAGISPGPSIVRRDRSRTLDSLRQFVAETGRTSALSYAEWRLDHPDTPTCRTISRWHGTWSNAVQTVLRSAGDLRGEPLLAGTTDKERQFLLEMARDAEMSSLSGIAGRLGESGSGIYARRAQLIAKKIIRDAGRGKMSFVQPQLRQLLRQHLAADTCAGSQISA